MKIRISDRIVAGLLAILLLAFAVMVFMQGFLGIPVLEKAVRFMSKGDFLSILAVIFGLLLVLFFAAACFSILIRHRGKKDRVISQDTENGRLDISIDAMIKLVEKCVNEHPEISMKNLDLNKDKKHGLNVSITGDVVGGISIPLTVAKIQKHVKQYVNNCTGVEIDNVIVLVQETGNERGNATFSVEDPIEGEETEEKPEDEETIETVQIPEVPVLSSKDDEKEEDTESERESSVFTGFSGGENIISDDDDRPLHQRIFSSPETPCIVPCPPEMNKEEEQEKVAEPEQKESDETEEEKTEVTETEEQTPVSEDADTEDKVSESDEFTDDDDEEETDVKKENEDV